MSADDTRPTLPLPDPQAQGAPWAEARASAPRRPRWPWIVVLAVVAVLAGEWLARGIVERTIRAQLTTSLDLPADQRIDIDIPGPILPQLIVGSLGDVTISSDDVSLRGITVDVAVSAQDVPVWGGGDWSGASATVRLDQTQLQAVLAQVDGFPAGTVTLDAPDVNADFELSLFGLAVPVGVSLTPGAAGGDIVLTPSTLRVSGAEVSAEALRQQFGAIASTVLRDWEVCIADRLPRAVALTSVRVEGDRIVAGFEIDSAILADETAQQPGTCA